MSEFHLFFRLGIDHIFNIQNSHNILFLISLFALYPAKQWSKILILITAFSLGHCVSLSLLFFKILPVSPAIIGFLFPALVLLSAILNLPQKSDKFNPEIYKLKYITALLFGILQGAGFFNEMERITVIGNKLFIPFISYNLGIELGQVFIIIAITSLALVSVDLLKVKRRDLVLLFTGIVVGASLIMMIDRFPW